jgi:hypothetical protein
MKAALGWLADGRIPMRGLYDLSTPDRAQAVYQDVLQQRLDKLAIIFDWTKLTGN